MSSPPSTLGQYQIIREIARSNDIVYEAYDPLMNRRVAIKELSVPQGTTPQQQEDRINRFKREAQAAGTLNHANIMTVYSFAEDAGRTFMAMEYLDGCTLRNELDTKGSIPVDRAVEIATQLLEGLGHAHSKGVIQRDIKPDNIQILSNGQVKITDFGIARLTFQPNLTMDGQVFGTPSYMSPEQVVGKDIDARSDLFSVGVVLYEMVGGVKPFTGDSVVSITYAIMNKTPDAPASCPHPLWLVIQRVLDKTPHLRFGAAQDMIDAIREAMRPNPSPNYVPQTQTLGTIPPMFNPAMNPYGAPPPVAPPPAVYSFNPYQPGGQNPPFIQGGPPMPPPGTIPIYYPPPPRAPLMKPETVVFVKRLAVVFVLVGSIFALMFVIISALTSRAKVIDDARNDSQIEQTITNNDPQYPLEERIRDAEAKLVKLRTEARKDAAKKQIAVLYEQLGKRELNRDSRKAEDAYNKAVEYDPQNSAYASDLATLYATSGQTQNDPNQKTYLFDKSAEFWERAGRTSADAKRRDDCLAQSAIMYRECAVIARDLGDSKEARRRYEQARAVAPPTSQIASTIDRESAQMIGL